MAESDSHILQGVYQSKKKALGGIALHTTWLDFVCEYARIIRISFSAALAEWVFIRQFCLLPSS